MEFSCLLFIFEKILFFTLELIVFVSEIIFTNSFLGNDLLFYFSLNKIGNTLVVRTQNEFFFQISDVIYAWLF